MLDSGVLTFKNPFECTAVVECVREEEGDFQHNAVAFMIWQYCRRHRAASAKTGIYPIYNAGELFIVTQPLDSPTNTPLKRVVQARSQSSDGFLRLLRRMQSHMRLVGEVAWITLMSSLHKRLQ